MDTLFNNDAEIKITGNREQSLVNVTLDFWTSDNTRFMELFCKVRIIGEPEVVEVFTPLLMPDSDNPIRFSNSFPFSWELLEDVFSKRFTEVAKKRAIDIALMKNAPDNQTINNVKGF